MNIENLQRTQASEAWAQLSGEAIVCKLEISNRRHLRDDLKAAIF
jgi:hypothetical protein